MLNIIDKDSAMNLNEFVLFLITHLPKFSNRNIFLKPDITQHCEIASTLPSYTLHEFKDNTGTTKVRYCDHSYHYDTLHC